MSEPATTPAECQTCGYSDRGCCVVTQLIGGAFQSRWLCAEPPDTHGSTERHSPPTSAAPWWIDTVLAARCPRCSAGPERPCRSVRGPWRGREKSWPHPARVRAAS